MLRPIIITAGSTEQKGVPNFYINRSYCEAIERAGATLLVLGRTKDTLALSSLLSLTNGVLLIGGHDIDPKRYGETNRDCRNIDEERDRLEFELIRGAHDSGKPILGICRGMQVLNVHFGGSLYQDVAKEMTNASVHDLHKDNNGNDLPRGALAHDVTIEKDSLLARISRKGTVRVNSLHHQGIKVLGKGLSAVAHSDDGLVEAIEINDHPFGLGVEWHPEELDDDVSRSIFSAFIKAAATNH